MKEVFEAQPCSLCSTTGGRASARAWKPSRIDGARFGLGGKICYSCYGRLWSRERRAGRPAISRIRRLTPPCSSCGTLDGRVAQGCVSPARRSGDAWGLGPLCQKCWNRLRDRDRRDERRSAGFFPGLPALSPCTLCGTFGGTINKGCRRPSRRDGSRFRISGVLCKSCHHKLEGRERRRKEKVAGPSVAQVQKAAQDIREKVVNPGERMETRRMKAVRIGVRRESAKDGARAALAEFKRLTRGARA